MVHKQLPTNSDLLWSTQIPSARQGPFSSLSTASWCLRPAYFVIISEQGCWGLLMTSNNPVQESVPLQSILKLGYGNESVAEPRRQGRRVWIWSAVGWLSVTTTTDALNCPDSNSLVHWKDHNTKSWHTTQNLMITTNPKGICAMPSPQCLTLVFS